MKNISAIIVFLTLVLSGCALYSQTKFQEWRGNPIVLNGTGGIVDDKSGIEIWSAGLPKGKVEIIGLIQQKNYQDVFGLLNNYTDSQLAKTVQEHGGDGVLILNSRDVFKGYSNNVSGQLDGQVDQYGNLDATYQATGSSRAVYQKQKVLAVFRYIK